MPEVKRVYLDHAATTPVRPEVLAAMMPIFSDIFGNPSSFYKDGRDAFHALEKARTIFASCIGADPAEIFFTSCGTESDNWAIKGTAIALQAKGRHIITSSIEHHAVLHACDALEKQGYEITRLPVDQDGLIDPEAVRAAIRPDTILVTIMMANNEIGTIQPIKEIAAICRANKVCFHSDAVQAAGALPIDVRDLDADMLSFSGHKIYAPKGVGALYVRKGVRIANFMDGGAQERNRRGGTENVPSIVGFARAFELAVAEMAENSARLTGLRDALIDGMLARIPFSRLNGHRTLRLPNNANFSFQYIEGESILLMLDYYGYECSSGSACTSGSLDPSHVLLGIGLPHEIAHGSLRVTMGHINTMADVENLINDMEVIVERLKVYRPFTTIESEAQMEYSEKVMDHFMHPRNVGEIENADATGMVGNAKCGDIMKVFLKIENNIIVDAKFKTFGCGSAIATSSMATEMIKGKSIFEALTLTNKAVAQALDGLPPIKMHCSLLAEQAVKSALKEYFEKNGLMTDENRHLFDELNNDPHDAH